jgi:peptidyl-prolyl cis-trans isomerase SurA
MAVAQSKLVNHIRSLVGKDMAAGQSANDSAVLGFYRDNMEKYNPEFAEQLSEFKYGNLLFNIMQKKIWDPASADSMSQVAYYNEHPEKYWWEQSADALIITTPQPDSVSRLQDTIKADPSSWRKFSAASDNAILIDSGRFELSQLPVAERTNFSEGLVTAPVVNELDHTATFSYIIRLHREKERKQFTEARGAVITDYQDELENKWIAQLKKKYPVKINRKVLKSLPSPKPNP